MTRKEYNIAVKEYSQRVFAFAFRLSKCKEDADDYTQEAFTRLWKHHKKVELEKSRSWIFKTVYHLFLNEIKKKKRNDYIEEINLIEKSKSEDSFEMQDMIQHILKQLPELQQSIILLRDYEGYNYEEIGEILNLNESQVKVYLFRARKKFKQKIKGMLMWVA